VPEAEVEEDIPISKLYSRFQAARRLLERSSCDADVIPVNLLLGRLEQARPPFKKGCDFYS
jgi:hypothetical protein